MIKPCSQNNNLLRHSISTFTLSYTLTFFSHFLSQSRAKLFLDVYFMENNVKDMVLALINVMSVQSVLVEG